MERAGLTELLPALPKLKRRGLLMIRFAQYTWFFCFTLMVLGQERHTFYMPHFTFKAGAWVTQLKLHNPTAALQTVWVKAFDNQGELVAETQWQLGPLAGVFGPVNELLPEGSPEAGWLELQAETPEIRGIIKFTATASGGTSSLTTAHETSRYLVFPLLENTASWSAGMSLVNVSEETAALELELWDGDGHIRAMRNIELAPKAKLVSMAADLFEETPPELASLRVKSSVPITGFALSFHEGITQIVALPAESWTPGEGIETLAQKLENLIQQKAAFDPEVPGISLRVDAPSLGFSWQGAAGFADPGTGVPMAADTPFRIQQVAEIMIATVALRLEEEGILRLDASAATYLGAPALAGLALVDGVDHGLAITLEHLLSHRSGLPGLLEKAVAQNGQWFTFLDNLLADPAAFWKAEEVLAFARENLRSPLPPGSAFDFSHLNQALLVMALEKVTGEPLETILRRWVFEPAGMTNSWLEFRESHPAQTQLSHGYLQDNDITSIPVFAFDWSGGSLVSTTADLHRFMDALLKGDLFQNHATVERLFEQHSNLGGSYRYGLGTLLKDRDCLMQFGKVQGNAGLGAFLFHWPEKNITISGTLNQYREDGTSFATDVLQVIYGSGTCRDTGTWETYRSAQEAGFSQEGLERAIAYYGELDASAFLAIHDGKVLLSLGQVGRRYWIHSIRKSLLSGLYGIYQAEGEIDLDASLADLDLGDDRPLTTPESSAVVSDLLKARSGVYLPSAGTDGVGLPQRGAFPPGTHWYYNNWDFNALGTIFRQETETDIFAAFAQRIARPTGMQDFEAQDGHYFYEKQLSRHPTYFFRMTGRDMARFGQLFLQNGNWSGTALIPPGWVEESTASYSATGIANAPGYGYLWWVDEGGGYSARGLGGHKIKVLPRENMVFVIRPDTDTGRSVNHGQFLELVDKVLASRL